MITMQDLLSMGRKQRDKQAINNDPIVLLNTDPCEHYDRLLFGIFIKLDSTGNVIQKDGHNDN